MPTRPEEIPTAADYSLPESDLTGSRSTLRHHQPAAFTSVGRRGVMQVGNISYSTVYMSYRKRYTIRVYGTHSSKSYRLYAWILSRKGLRAPSQGTRYKHSKRGSAQGRAAVSTTLNLDLSVTRAILVR